MNKIKVMGAIIIKTKDASELKFVKELLRRSRIKNKELSDEDFEDILLGEIMSTRKTGKTVSKSTIIKKLKK